VEPRFLSVRRVESAWGFARLPLPPAQRVTRARARKFPAQYPRLQGEKGGGKSLAPAPRDLRKRPRRKAAFNRGSPPSLPLHNAEVGQWEEIFAIKTVVCNLNIRAVTPRQPPNWLRKYTPALTFGCSIACLLPRQRPSPLEKLACELLVEDVSLRPMEKLAMSQLCVKGPLSLG